MGNVWLKPHRILMCYSMVKCSNINSLRSVRCFKIIFLLKNKVIHALQNKLPELENKTDIIIAQNNVKFFMKMIELELLAVVWSARKCR